MPKYTVTFEVEVDSSNVEEAALLALVDLRYDLVNRNRIDVKVMENLSPERIAKGEACPITEVTL